MKIEPYIMRGPDMCGLEECMGKFCTHERTLGQKAITWQEDNGDEWGNAMMFGLPLSAASEAHIDKALWHQYEQWHEGQD